MKPAKLLITALTILGVSSSISLAGAGVQGHSHGDSHGANAETAFGQAGDPKKPARIINVTMRETDGKMLFVPNAIEVKKGEQIRFMLRNNGELDHEIILATFEENQKHAIKMQKNPDMEHDDANAKRLAPKKMAEMVWQFTKAGEFDFACLIPGHREAGMHGKITVR